MSKAHAHSSPYLFLSSNHDDTPFDGVAVNVKLLLKLIQDHNEASTKDDDGRKAQRMAGMISIIEDVKTRIEKSHRPGKVELWHYCNSKIKQSQITREKKPQEPIQGENQKLRKELSATLTAQKSLEKMFSSLGKEKEIIAAELARKVQELNGMEEHLNDLKAQNEMLSDKVKNCAAEHKKKKGGDTPAGNAGVQERNRTLSDQLLKSLEGYRSLKRKLKDAQEENVGIRMTVEEIAKKIAVGLEKIHDFRRRVARQNEEPMNVEEELSAVERMFRSFQAKLTIGGAKRSEYVKPKADMSADEAPPVLA
ncbi:uncharacterized protein LOC143855182 [Tasmannia lanceolata]|uniref:uncharacterized protein LOC143855182 n=1 Tax=Tasmannia lanceolata TaxID=3420 RepID=UPI004064C187